MVATCSSETSVDFQRTKRRYIGDVKALHRISYAFFKLLNNRDSKKPSEYNSVGDPVSYSRVP
jgi:hypothetical protein